MFVQYQVVMTIDIGFLALQIELDYSIVLTTRPGWLDRFKAL